jgi:predicted metal-dependent enzyme (double-stranded beta helix superfamily)
VIEAVTIDAPSLGDRTCPVRPAQLAQIALRIADHPGQWLSLVRYDPGRCWHLHLGHDEEHEIWLLSWLPGQQTGFHDHGPSAGAFAVARGFLRERAALGAQPAPTRRTLAPGAVRSFGPEYVHDVRNESAWPAVSIHAYSPPLSSISRRSLAADAVLPATAEDRT